MAVGTRINCARTFYVKKIVKWQAASNNNKEQIKGEETNNQNIEKALK